MAAAVLAGCLGVIAAGLAAASCLSSGPWWWPLPAALPVAAWQVGADLTGRGRQLAAEAAGAVAMGAAAPAIVLAAGGDAATAWGLWAVLAARSLPSILLVRAQLRRGRGEPGAAGATHTAQGIALAGVGGLAAIGALPWAAAAALAALWLWAGISLARPPVPTHLWDGPRCWPASWWWLPPPSATTSAGDRRLKENGAMRLHNVHERALPVPAASAGRLLDGLGGRPDLLWPGESWPPMRFDRPLQVGADGGHGPIRYRVEEHAPGAGPASASPARPASPASTSSQ